MARKNPNGYGGITKLSGNRKKPFMAYVSEMFSEGINTQPQYKKALKSKFEALQGIENRADAMEMVEMMLADRSADELKQIAQFILDQDDKKTFKVKQRKKSIGYYETYKQAQIALAEYNKTPFDLKNRKITFEQVWQQVLPTLNLENLSASSKHHYLWGFEACKPIHKMPLCDIRAAHLQDIIDSYKDKSKSTQHKPMAVMNTVFDFAIKNDIVDKDYSKYVEYTSTENKNKKIALTKEEVQFLWDNANYRHNANGSTALSNVPVAEMLLVLVYTGIRIQELLSLKVEDVHIDQNYMEIKGTKTAAANRIVPIHNRIKPIIESHCIDTYLFEDNRGRGLKYNSFQANAYKPFCDRFNYNHTIHEHRHTFATYSALTMNGKARAFIIGHSQGITDDIYTHPEMIVEMLHQEINKFEI